ncbi:hypothetical protein AQ490_20975 [Wenjunlia vitaminophila]|uniref:Uncharacterized protein n=1 Tax=Wenjunlia vitaminophila TaxID=76728 RepID=A0A0T6LTN6_WENVI|nr:hypothetical protein [Wenjunlia vitaminophila]KRV49451.1 hypothetical protein AQ490_20975 [Wenjunlia vitaminophila]
MAVPPVWITRGPGPHWRVPFSAEEFLTAPGPLRAALRVAVERPRGPGADAPRPGLTAAQRAWRDAVLSTRLREVNHRSRRREARPW